MQIAARGASSSGTENRRAFRLASPGCFEGAVPWGQPLSRSVAFKANRVITSFLFERPIVLGIALFLFAFFLSSYWARRRTCGARRACWAGLAALLLFPSLSVLVETRTERVTAELMEMSRLVGQAGVETISARLAPDFQAAGMDRSAFLQRWKSALDRIRPREAKVTEIRVVWDESKRGRMECVGHARLASEESLLEWVRVRFRAEFFLAGDQLQITSLVVVSDRLSPISDLRQMMD